MGKSGLSSIAKKLIMSVSGLFLITFLVVHLGANLVALFSAEAYNAVCHFMDTNPLIRIMVPVLALGFAVHILYAALLTLQNREARGSDRYGCASKTNVKWASRNMFVLGLIVVGFLGMHLFHFWGKMQLQTIKEMAGLPALLCENPYELVASLFSQPLYVVIYLVWVGALWFHLTHGFWSAFQSIGLSNGVWQTRLQCLGNIYAGVVAIGFAFIPLFFYIFK